MSFFGYVNLTKNKILEKFRVYSCANGKIQNTRLARCNANKSNLVILKIP